MRSKKSKKSFGNKSKKSYKRIKIQKSKSISKKTKKKLNKLARNKSKIFKKRTKKNRKKNIMKGGAKYKEEELIHTINQTKIDLPLYKIEGIILDVGMGGLHKSEIPIATYGIANCMGIGTHINGINYFSHASAIDYSGGAGRFSLMYEWKRLLSDNIGKINLIYLYTPYGIPEESLFFLNILNDLELICKTIHVNTRVFNDITKCYVNEWDSDFKVGISKDGPWGYDYSSASEEAAAASEEAAARVATHKSKAESFKDKVVKLKNPTLFNKKMRWLCSEVHSKSHNLKCHLHTNDKGNLVGIDGEPTIIKNPDDLELSP